MITKRLLLLTLVLLPLGTIISISLSSIYTLSLFLVVFIFFLKYPRIFLVLLAFLFAHLLLAIAFSHELYLVIPWERCLASTIFLIPYLTSLLSQKPLVSEVSFKSLYKTLIFTRSCAVVFAIISIANMLFFHIRSHFPFDEPTRLGLFLISISISLAYIKVIPLYSRISPSWLEILIILCGAISTLTIHIVLVVPVLLTLLLPQILRVFKAFQIKKHTFLLALATFTILPVFLVVIVGIIPDLSEKILSLIAIQESTNLSSLSWLRGLSSLEFTYINSPVFGFGIGTLGYTDINTPFALSIDHQFLLLSSVILNETDGYSMYFRLSHDLGLILFAFILVLTINKFLSSINYWSQSTTMKPCVGSYDSSELHTVMLFFKVVGLSLFYGSLLKEPILTSFPFVYVPLLLAL